MTGEEVWDLLAVIAVHDLRHVGQTDHDVWTAHVGDLPFTECRDAVIAHYRDSSDRIMPADVRSRVREIRADRLERNIPAPPPADLTDDPKAYIAWRRDQLAAIRDGRPEVAAAPQRPAIGGDR